MFVCVAMATRSHLLRMYYVHPPNHLFHVQVYSLFVCFGQLLPAGDGGGGGEGGGSVADVATREEESQTGSGGKWVGWGELVPLSFNMYSRMSRVYLYLCIIEAMFLINRQLCWSWML